MGGLVDTLDDPLTVGDEAPSNLAIGPGLDEDRKRGQVSQDWTDQEKVGVDNFYLVTIPAGCC